MEGSDHVLDSVTIVNIGSLLHNIGKVVHRAGAIDGRAYSISGTEWVGQKR
jgi:metal-dependent HD superfamily phosphatase/phosphodiesterase